MVTTSKTENSYLMKIIIALISIALVAFVVFSLMNSSNSQKKSNLGDKSIIRINLPVTDEKQIDVLLEQVAMVNKSLPQYKVVLETNNTNDYLPSLKLDKSQGNMACIIGINNLNYTDYLDYYYPMSDKELSRVGIREENFYESAWKLFKVDGKSYGVAHEMNNPVVVLNKTLLANAGLSMPEDSWNVAQFEEYLQKLNGSENKALAVTNDPNIWQALPAAYSATPAVSEDGRINFGDNNYIMGATWYVDLVTEKGYALPVGSEIDRSWGQNLYQGGKAAITIDSTANIMEYLRTPIDSAVLPIPTSATGEYTGSWSGKGYAISKDCADKDAALEVLGKLNSISVQKLNAQQAASVPVYKSLESTYLKSFDKAERDNVERILKYSLTSSSIAGSISDYKEVDSKLSEGIYEAYQGNQDVALMLKQIASASN